MKALDETDTILIVSVNVVDGMIFEVVCKWNGGSEVEDWFYDSV